MVPHGAARCVVGFQIMHSPLISVIVPVYNTALYLRRCLGSLCCQTYLNLQIICVDDGWTDESPVILTNILPEILV